jgi:hypothetical protein
MKKIPFKILTSILTFAFGISVVLFWFYIESDKTVNIDPPYLVSEECLKTDNFPGLSRELANVKRGKTGYFPERIFSLESGKDVSIDEEPGAFFAEIWFGQFLIAANEKSLLGINDKYSEVYRFTYLESFGHPIIVRIEKKIDRIELKYTELNGQGGYEPGRIIDEKVIPVGEKDWCRLKKILNEADYWRMPAMIDRSGLDGSSWLIEGVKDNRYQMVYRWTPEKDKFREAGTFLLELSGFDLWKLDR